MTKAELKFMENCIFKWLNKVEYPFITGKIWGIKYIQKISEIKLPYIENKYVYKYITWNIQTVYVYINKRRKIWLGNIIS